MNRVNDRKLVSQRKLIFPLPFGPLESVFEQTHAKCGKIFEEIIKHLIRTVGSFRSITESIYRASSDESLFMDSVVSI